MSKTHMTIHWILYFIAQSILLCAAADALSTVARSMDANEQAPAPQGTTVGDSVINAYTEGFQSSLEMKENTEFLLTPALLLQESLSSEAIMTFPSE